MAVAAVKQLPSILTPRGSNEPPGLSQFIPILASGEFFVKKGYVCDRDIEKCDYEIKQSYEPKDDVALHKITILRDGNTQPPGTYLIANPGGEEANLALAREYVNRDVDCIKKRGLPLLEIGDLKSIDRWEIEAFNNIQNVILNYAYSKEQQPLSITVFGPPGSGKSFGVKQIAKNALGKDTVEVVVFNVSQFSDEDDLGVAFQQVRDIILKGKLPLVFFDEFDSEGCKWLKNFLMPMQDGEFKDNGGVHPLGKCILIFAGGTSNTFDKFSAANPGEIQKYKDHKVPDFVSRVKANINIAGPNPRSGDDTNYILRRALLLHSFREEFGISCIDSNVLTAMLLVPKFEHGTRSMKTIIQMSKIINGKLSPAGLPMGEQMKLHVNDRKFTDILLIDAITASLDGQIAQKIHEHYIEKKRETGVIKPTAEDWKDLSMKFKLSKFDQARSYSKKLRLIGCKAELMDLSKDALTVFTKDEELIMAKQEHDRWMQEKLDDGWNYSTVRDNNKKLHDCLVQWEQLSEDMKNRAKELVRNIIPILQSQGYCVYRK
jgi:hypothetical protein